MSCFCQPKAPLHDFLRQDLGGVSSRSAAYVDQNIAFAVLTNGLRYTGEEQPTLTRTEKKMVVGSVLSQDSGELRWR